MRKIKVIKRTKITIKPCIIISNCAMPLSQRSLEFSVVRFNSVLLSVVRFISVISVDRFISVLSVD